MIILTAIMRKINIEGGFKMAESVVGKSDSSRNLFNMSIKLNQF